MRTDLTTLTAEAEAEVERVAELIHDAAGRARAALMPVRISMTYTVAAADLKDILEAGGLWRPIPGSDWMQWKTVKGLGHFGPRGLAMLAYDPGGEAIVDLCRRVRPPRRTRLPPPPRRPGGGAPPIIITPGGPLELRPGGVVPPGLGGLLGSVFKPPPSTASFVAYSATVRTASDSGAVVTRSLPTAPIADARSPAAAWDVLKDALPGGSGLAVDPYPLDGAFSVPSNQQLGTVAVQRRAAPTTYLTLSGYAIRAGYPVPVPRLATLDGTELVPVNTPDGGGFSQAVAGGVGVPLYLAAWELPFVLSGKAEINPIPPNQIADV